MSKSSTRKRSRSPSGSRGSSRSSSISKGGKQQPAASLHGHAVLSQWQLLHDRSVMALPPSAATVKQRLVVLPHPQPGGTAVMKVAAFDMDDTLLVYSRSQKANTTSSSSGADDLKWRYDNVPQYLKHLNDKGFLVVIFSNQSGIAKSTGWDSGKAAAVQKKIVDLSTALDVPLAAFVSTRYDRWRKPQPSMWGALQECVEECASLGSGTRLDCSAQSFYVGDAAGRPAGAGGRKKDFSCSDRRFAYNLKLPFFTPEQFFLPPITEVLSEAASADPLGCTLRRDYVQKVEAAPGEFSWDGISPSDLRDLPTSYAALATKCITASGESQLVTPPQAPFFAASSSTPSSPGGSQELVLLVGFPSSGKSTFYRRHFQPYGYVHVNRDTLATKERCVKLLEQSWMAGKSVVVDNTNPTAADRKLFIDVVRRLHKGPAGGSLPVRAFVLCYSKQMAQHLNGMRSRLGLAARIPDVAFNVFQSRYIAFTPAALKSEGIASAIEVPPVACFDGLPPRTQKEFYVLS